MIVIDVIDGSGGACSYELEEGSYVLGVGTEAQIVVESDRVEESHLSLDVTNDELSIRDLGTAEGVCVDGEPISESRVRKGQLVGIGDVTLCIRNEESEDPEREVESWDEGRADNVISADPNALKTPSFLSLIGGALIYPFTGQGGLTLLGGTAFFAILLMILQVSAIAGPLGWIFGIIIAFVSVSLLGQLFQSVVQAAAQGEDDINGWGDMFASFSDSLGPSVYLSFTVVLCAIPGAIASFFMHRSGIEFSADHWVAHTLVHLPGFFCLPMALMAVALIDNIFAANPILCIHGISKTFGDYLVLFVLVVGVGAATVAVGRGLGSIDAPDAIAWLSGLGFALISIFVRLAGIMLCARLLGVFYLANRRRLGWFRHRYVA